MKILETMQKTINKSKSKNINDNVQVTKKKIIDFFKSEKNHSNIVDIAFYENDKIRKEKSRVIVFGENYMYLEKGFWIAFSDVLQFDVKK